MTAAVDLPVSARYRLVPTRSSARFAVKHLGVFTVTGEFTVTSGAVVVEDGVAGVHAELDATSFRSGNTKRDKDIRSAAFLDTATYPAIVFDGEVVGDQVRGRLAVHGRTVPTDLAITVVHRSPHRVDVRATATLDRHTAGVTGARLLIGRSVHITITATFLPASHHLPQRESSPQNAEFPVRVG